MWCASAHHPRWQELVLVQRLGSVALRQGFISRLAWFSSSVLGRHNSSHAGRCRVLRRTRSAHRCRDRDSWTPRTLNRGLRCLWTKEAGVRLGLRGRDPRSCRRPSSSFPVHWMPRGPARSGKSCCLQKIRHGSSTSCSPWTPICVGSSTKHELQCKLDEYRVSGCVPVCLRFSQGSLWHFRM